MRVLQICLLVVIAFFGASFVSGDDDSTYYKRFGRGYPKTKVEVLDNFSTAEEFYTNYVKPGIPVIFANVVPTLGTLIEDLKFLNLRKIGRFAVSYTSGVMKVGNDDRSTMSFRTYAKEQKWGFLMSNGEMPIPIREQVTLPPIFNCSDVTNTFYDTLMTYVMLDYQGPLRSDPRENLLCQMNGGMSAVLITSDFKYKEELLDQENGTLSSVDIVRVDMRQYSYLEEADYWEALFGAGDCIYIPSGWIYQLNSKKGDTSFTLRWESDATTTIDFDSCETLPADTTLADVRFPDDKFPIGPIDESGLNRSDRDLLSYLFEEYFYLGYQDQKSDFKEFSDRLNKDTVLLGSEGVALPDSNLVKDLFNLLDKTSDGSLNPDDVDAFSESQESLKPTATKLFQLIGQLSLRRSLDRMMKQLEDELESIIGNEEATPQAVKKRLAKWHTELTAEWMADIRKVWIEEGETESAENKTNIKDEL